MDEYERACAARGVAPFDYIAAQLQGAVIAAESGDGPGIELDIRGTAVPLQVARRRFEDADLCAVVDTIRALQLGNIEALYICSHAKVTDQAATALASILPGLGLRHLDIHDNAIGSTGARALIEALLVCPSLESVIFDGNPIGEDGGVAVAALIQHHANLQSLSAARCELGIDSLIRISSALQETASLAHLDVSEPRLFTRNEEATYHLARALRDNTSLRSLALRKVPYFTATSVNSLCDYLMDNGRIQWLDLSCNHFAGPGGALLAAFLKAGCPLETLVIAHCRVGDEGAVALAEAVEQGCSLRHLDVRGNDIGDKGVAALARVVTSLGAAAAGSASSSVASSVYGSEGANSGGMLDTLLIFGGNNLKPGRAGTTALGTALMAAGRGRDGPVAGVDASVPQRPLASFAVGAALGPRGSVQSADGITAAYVDVEPYTVDGVMFCAGAASDSEGAGGAGAGEAEA